MFPYFIGFTVACLSSLYGAHTSGSFNPAREFGPRFVAYLAGWGKIALPGHHGGWWAYIIGPLIGGPIGGALHDFIVARGYAPEPKDNKPAKSAVYEAAQTLSPETEAAILKLISEATKKASALSDSEIETVKNPKRKKTRRSKSKNKANDE